MASKLLCLVRKWHLNLCEMSGGGLVVVCGNPGGGTDEDDP